MFRVMTNVRNTITEAFHYFGHAFLFQFMLGYMLAVAATSFGQVPAPDSPAIEAQARSLVAKLTLEQKIHLLAGVDEFFTQSEPAIGVPRFKMSDGTVGVRTWGPSTAYPSGVSMAASWDPELTRKVGAGLGKDARAQDVHFLLGPGVNIARSPLDGRNFEFFSEDPFLNSRLVVPYIEGVQSQGVVAVVKHLAANNSEYNRHNVSADVDERTLREIYLPSFEAAVKDAHVDSVMDSYNLLNGVHSTQSEFLNLKLLKGEWNFQGILMTDWEAIYDCVAAANNGVDLEMPRPDFMNAACLVPAVKNGSVKESTIDDKLVRYFRVALRYGFMDRPQWDPAYSTYSLANRAVALDGARESLTLLKNEGHLLPLDAAKVKTIAIIGPDAWPAVSAGGGSSLPEPFEPVSLLTGISNLLGPNVRILYTRGLPSVTDVFDQTVWKGDIQETTYMSRDFTGTSVDDTPLAIDRWKKEMWNPQDKTPRSIRYTATYKPARSGKYLLVAAASSEDTYKVFVDGKLVLEQLHFEGQFPHAVPLDLTAGQNAKVVVEYLPYSPGIRFGLGIVDRAKLVSEDAKKFASAADVAVVAVGFEPVTEAEAYDRAFALPWGQDELIETVAAANHRTVVTLTAGGGADLHHWVDKVPALLDTYYPGQEGGTAIAEVLFGKHNPEGKLPVSFDRSWEENPSAPYYYPIKGADTSLHVVRTNGKIFNYVIPHVKYLDGLMVGYRYWTTTGKHPLFPFGFGLSYTTFSFSNLNVPATAKRGSTVPVSFDVTNTGDVAGAEVVQLYVSNPSAKVPRPERELKGFEKVRLAPGETRHVTLNLDARAFSYWDVTIHNWTIDPGKFVLRVGNSSENTPLSADLTMAR
jgi:beta-glucosidase